VYLFSLVCYCYCRGLTKTPSSSSLSPLLATSAIDNNREHENISKESVTQQNDLDIDTCTLADVVKSMNEIGNKEKEQQNQVGASSFFHLYVKSLIFHFIYQNYLNTCVNSFTHLYQNFLFHIIYNDP